MLNHVRIAMDCIVPARVNSNEIETKMPTEGND